MFSRHNGHWCSYFEQHARNLAAQGQFGASRTAYGRAVLSSPLHSLLHLAKPCQLRLVWSITALALRDQLFSRSFDASSASLSSE
jgi:hypothetical protein